MKKITFGLSALFVLSFTSTFAQINAQGASSSGVLTFYKNNSDKKTTAIGSQYIDSDFQAAKVNNGSQIFQIRFNAFTNVMEYKKDNEELILIKKDNTLIQFNNGKTYELHTYKDKKGKEHDSYLVVIKKEPKASILKLEKVSFNEARSAANTYDTGSPAEYKKSGDTYFIKLGNEITELPTRTKEFTKLIPNKENEIKKFFKENKINFKDDSDLIKLTTFLNSIL